MISISENLLKIVCKIHTKEISKIMDLKLKVINLCLIHYGSLSKKTKKEFNDELKKILGDDTVRKQAVNWFLMKSTNKTKTSSAVQRNLSSINKTDLFFVQKFRLLPNKIDYINAIKEQVQYFDSNKIISLLEGKPEGLEKESERYKKIFSKKYNEQISKHIVRFVNFIFDYDEFSDKNSAVYSKTWGAYKLTEKLEIRSCLYCNRNYVLTVTNCGRKIIRPELDHFFPQSRHPILCLSFYNLIPSCHICNSNLKGKVEFTLDKYFHPYLNSFDKEKIVFTYEPKNPAAFFNNPRGLKIKLDTKSLARLNLQIEGNIKLFQLDEIYNSHQDIVEGLMELQRKTNKKKISDIYNNILVDNMGKKYSMSEKEIYELAIRNYYNEDEFHKKPMAKFERDIALELKLITKI